MVPVKLLEYKYKNCKDCKPEKVDGMELFNELVSKSRVINELRKPNDAGIVPVNLLPLTKIVVRELSFPILEGSVLVKALPIRLISFNAAKKPIERGIDPMITPLVILEFILKFVILVD